MPAKGRRTAVAANLLAHVQEREAVPGSRPGKLALYQTAEVVAVLACRQEVAPHVALVRADSGPVVLPKVPEEDCSGIVDEMVQPRACVEPGPALLRLPRDQRLQLRSQLGADDVMR